MYCYVHNNSAPYLTACRGTESPNGWTVRTIAAIFGLNVPSDLDAAVGSWMKDIPRRFYLVKNNMIYTSNIEFVSGTDFEVRYVSAEDAVTFTRFKMSCTNAAISLGQNTNEYFYYQDNKFYETFNNGSLRNHGKPCKLKEW